MDGESQENLLMMKVGEGALRNVFLGAGPVISQGKKKLVSEEK